MKKVLALSLLSCVAVASQAAQNKSHEGNFWQRIKKQDVAEVVIGLGTIGMGCYFGSDGSRLDNFLKWGSIVAGSGIMLHGAVSPVLKNNQWKAKAGLSLVSSTGILVGAPASIGSAMAQLREVTKDCEGIDVIITNAGIIGLGVVGLVVAGSALYNIAASAELLSMKIENEKQK